VKTVSPCIKNGSTSTAPGNCEATDSSALCNSIWTVDTFFSAPFTDTSNYGGVVGLAKDGHVIYGPYNDDGELWACEETDMCNGFLLADGSYGYASTGYFPYTVGCWGPAPGPAETAVICSGNACVGGSMAGLAPISIIIAAAALLELF